jgi:hypothetical protein
MPVTTNRASAIIQPTSDDLYEQDILSWSEHQADLLAALSRQATPG